MSRTIKKVEYGYIIAAIVLTVLSEEFKFTMKLVPDTLWTSVCKNHGSSRGWVLPQ